MARIRTIKPSFWTDENLSGLSESTHLLAAALLNYADDAGYFNANPKLIQAECCPLREPSVSVTESLKALSEIGFLRLGTGADGRRYAHIIHFLDHQRISHPTESKIKDLQIEWESSRSPHGVLPNLSALKGREGNKEGKGNTSSLRSDVYAPSSRAPKPRKNATSLPEAFPDSEALRAAQGYWTLHHRIDLHHDVREQAEAFRDHHTSHGTTSKDWRASWRTWCRNALKFNRPNGNGATHDRRSAHDKFLTGIASSIARREAADRESEDDRGDAGPTSPPLLPR